MLWCRKKNDVAHQMKPAAQAQVPTSGLGRAMEQRTLNADSRIRDHTIMVIAKTTADKVVVVTDKIDDQSLAFTVPDGCIDLTKGDKEKRERASEVFLERTGIGTSPASMRILGYLEDASGNKSDFVVAVYQVPLSQEYLESVMTDDEHFDKGVTTVYPLSSAIIPQQRKWLNIALRQSEEISHKRGV